MKTNPFWILKLLRKMFRSEPEPIEPKVKKTRKGKETKKKKGKKTRLTKEQKQKLKDTQKALKKLYKLHDKLRKEKSKLRDLEEKREAYYKQHPSDLAEAARKTLERREEFRNRLIAINQAYHNDPEKARQIRAQLYKDFTAGEKKILNEYMKSLGIDQKAFKQGRYEQILATVFTNEQAHLFGRNLGFLVDKFIKKYGEDYQYHLAKHIIRENTKAIEQYILKMENITGGYNETLRGEFYNMAWKHTKFGKTMHSEAERFLLWHKSNGAPALDMFYFKKKYGDEKFYETRSAYEDLKRWAAKSEGKTDYFKHIKGKYESKFGISMAEFKYLEYKNTKSGRKKIESLIERSTFKWIDDRLRIDLPANMHDWMKKDIHQMFAKYDNVDLAYAIGSGRAKKSYDKLIEYIYENQDRLLFNPKNARGLTDSPIFFQQLYEWGMKRGEKGAGGMGFGEWMSKTNDLYSRVTSFAKDNYWSKHLDTSRMERVQNKKFKDTTLTAGWGKTPLKYGGYYEGSIKGSVDKNLDKPKDKKKKTWYWSYKK